MYSMCGSSPSRSTLNTNVITGVGMCKVCTGTRGKGVVNGSPTVKDLKCAGCFFSERTVSCTGRLLSGTKRHK